jgi:hypothetical protein
VLLPKAQCSRVPHKPVETNHPRPVLVRKIMLNLSKTNPMHDIKPVRNILARLVSEVLTRTWVITIAEFSGKFFRAQLRTDFPASHSPGKATNTLLTVQLDRDVTQFLAVSHPSPSSINLVT